MDMGGIRVLEAIGLLQEMACEFNVCPDRTMVDEYPAWV